MISARIVFSSEALWVFEKLKNGSASSKHDRMISNAIERKLDLLKIDPDHGNPLSKKLIPREYAIKYSITNVFRLELPLFWRMLYSLESGESGEIMIFILDIIGHKAYDDLLGYRKK